MNPCGGSTVRFAGIVVLTILAGACSRVSTGKSSSNEAEHMRRVAALVTQYQQATKKRPAKIEEVRDWAVKEGKASQEDFASTRDNEPYGIAFTTTGVVVYEQTGKDGKCYIMRMGSVSQLTAEDVRQLAQQEEVGPKGGPQKKKTRSP